MVSQKKHVKSNSAIITPIDSVSQMRDAINLLPVSLLKAARAEDAEAQFCLAMLTLCQNKMGFAKEFFQAAAKNGSVKAKDYLELLQQVLGKKEEESAETTALSFWRELVIDREAHCIAFGGQN